MDSLPETVTIPVPQADDLDKVFEVVEIVASGKTTAQDVADELEMVARQGFYYTAAAEQLGLVDHDEEKHTISLTAEGRRYAAADDGLKARMRRTIVMHAPIIKHLARELGISRPTAGNHAHLFEDTQFVSDTIEEMGFAPETALRRAYTIKAWMKNL